MLQRQYYFAFGSNMCLAQMAERCPESTFIGKATLKGYRWQINQRHVANIIKVSNSGPSKVPVDEAPGAEPSSVQANQADMVEGLVFSISDKDRRTLDRKEGIKLGAYERVVLNVLLERHPEFADNKTGFVLERLQDGTEGVVRPVSARDLFAETGSKAVEMPDAPEIDKSAGDSAEVGKSMAVEFQVGQNEEHSIPQSSVPSERLPVPTEGPTVKGEEIEAITYLSTKYSDNGLIRQEYIQRMENAIRDAVKLGVSRDFVLTCLEPYVHGEVHVPEEEVKQETPSTQDPSAAQKVLEAKRMKAEAIAASSAAADTAAKSASGPSAKPAQKLEPPSRSSPIKKGISSLKSKKQPSKVDGQGEEESVDRKPHPGTGDGGQASKKEQDKGSGGIWSSVSSMFGTSQTQGGTKAAPGR